MSCLLHDVHVPFFVSRGQLCGQRMYFMLPNTCHVSSIGYIPITRHWSSEGEGGWEFTFDVYVVGIQFLFSLLRSQLEEHCYELQSSIHNITLQNIKVNKIWFKSSFIIHIMLWRGPSLGTEETILLQVKISLDDHSTLSTTRPR